mmetsp:Transcript_22023/g.61127  ORF Transcript_22023/g.61127 Transcript_22023/m.61127 type:complete len:167 (+) Transcript_22023:224-724(+)
MRSYSRFLSPGAIRRDTLSTENPAEFARVLQDALHGVSRDASGVTSAQLRLAGTAFGALAFCLGLWGATDSVDVACAWFNGLLSELFGGVDRVLALVLLFSFFQLVPLAQEKVLLTGTIPAVALQTLLASSRGDVLPWLWPLCAAAASAMLLLGIHTYRSATNSMR